MRVLRDWLAEIFFMILVGYIGVHQEIIPYPAERCSRLLEVEKKKMLKFCPLAEARVLGAESRAK